MRCVAIAVLLLIALTGAGRATEPVAAREQLHAVLWLQHSAEYRALVEQSYRAATARVRSQAAGSAALEQEAMPADSIAGLPAAVVLDVDETVLDNSWYQAALVRDGAQFSAQTWNEWVLSARATAVPGARDFVAAAVDAGVKIFYITNRECPATPATSGGDPCPQLTATRQNLLALGFPGAENPEAYLLRGVRDEWRSSDKSLRRAYLAQHYRIVAMIGDDLQDFAARDLFEARRAELTRLFGERWFLLPNPMYGSWERALAEPACADGLQGDECAAKVLSRKYALLQTQPLPLALESVATTWSRQASGGRLRMATWNIEYLLSPQTFAALADGCALQGEYISGATRRIPCDVARRLNRAERDFAALRRYAAQLDADVVALQEVDGPNAASLILPGYEFCFSARPHVQKNGFAIRRGVPFRCEQEYSALSLNDQVRCGVVVTLFPGEPEAMSLMTVHLKSGCPEGSLSAAGNRACATLSQQLAPLEAWIDAQANAGKRFAVMGDFNRRFARERGPARDREGRQLNVWPEINDGVPAAARLTNVTARERFTKCVHNDPYDAYIDTILVGRELARFIEPRSFRRVTYSADDVGAFKLSDHCPVATTVRIH